MPVQQCIATLSEKTQLTDKFWFLNFEMVEPHRLAFAAGQYISLAIPGNPARRSYSIASSPENDHGFELLIDTTPQGIGTTYLQKLEPGDEISFLAPLGLFTLANPEQLTREKSLVFVATGSGITPLRSMLHDLLHTQQDTREIWLYWGLRYPEDCFWLEEFQELDEAFANFHFHMTLSKAGEAWPLCKGRVTDCLANHEQPNEAGYYLCGNKAMIEDVSTFLLQDKQLPKEFLHHEKFY